jgi:hypothetical protein
VSFGTSGTAGARINVGMILLEMDKNNVIGLFILSASVCIFKCQPPKLLVVAALLACSIQSEVRDLIFLYIIKS